MSQPGWIHTAKVLYMPDIEPGTRQIQTSWQSGSLVDQMIFIDRFSNSIPRQTASKLLLNPLFQGIKVIRWTRKSKDLAKLANGLEFTVDYGWLWFLSDLLFKTLVFIHFYLGIGAGPL